MSVSFVVSTMRKIAIEGRQEDLESMVWLKLYTCGSGFQKKNIYASSRCYLERWDKKLILKPLFSHEIIVKISISLVDID